MHYFISLLSFLKRSLIAIVPLCLVLSSCYTTKQEEDNLYRHPIWHILDASEDDLDQDKCIITKFGRRNLRFHPASHQKCFNKDDTYTYVKDKKNIIHINSAYWVLTPNFYGSPTEERFPKTMGKGIKYRFSNNDSDKEEGMPYVFLEEWVAIDPNIEGAIFIISTGIDGLLGVSEPLKKALKDKKDKGDIDDYKILRSEEAIAAHEKYVKEGKKVYAFIHTAG